MESFKRMFDFSQGYAFPIMLNENNQNSKLPIRYDF